MLKGQASQMTTFLLNDLSLLDKNSFHIWKPMLHTFAAGSQLPEEQSIHLLTITKRHGFLYQLGEVSHINPSEENYNCSIFDSADKEVLPERFLNYDYLVVTISSKSNDFNTKGVKAPDVLSKIESLKLSKENQLVVNEHFHNATNNIKYHRNSS